MSNLLYPKKRNRRLDIIFSTKQHCLSGQKIYYWNKILFFDPIKAIFNSINCLNQFFTFVVSFF